MKNGDPLRFLKRRKDRTPSKYASQSSRSDVNTVGVSSIAESRLQQTMLLKQNCYDPNKYYSSSCQRYLKSINYQQNGNRMQKNQLQSQAKVKSNQLDDSIQDILVSFKKINNFKEPEQEIRELTFKKIDFEQSQGLSNKLKANVNEQKCQIGTFAEEADNAQSGAETQLKQCQICGRKFNIDSYQKHSRICEKVFVNKRKQFSSEKQRSQSKQKKGQ